MLSSFDEFPVHQTADVVRHVVTSDRNFYDRSYFNCHGIDDGVFLVLGMGQYPNLGVHDAFVLARRADRHTVVRASRPLTDRADLRVGPFSIDVLEPLRRLRVRLEASDHPHSFDLTWTGAGPPHEEPRHQWRSHGRVMIDTTRFAQVGRWEGTLALGDETFAVEPDRWWGTRDRSWGVRPIGEPEPAGIHGLGLVEQGFLWNYAPMQFADHAIVFMCQERGDGSRDLSHAARVWNDPERPVDDLGDGVHHHVLRPGTRVVERSVLAFPDSPDGAIEVAVEPMVDAFLQVGTGYGLDPDWRHGMYQGPDVVVQGLDLDMAADPGRFWGLVDSAARFTYGDHVGYGLHEYGLFGPLPRYGLHDLLDGAPDAPA
jgi:hypothetical protein